MDITPLQFLHASLWQRQKNLHLDDLSVDDFRFCLSGARGLILSSSTSLVDVFDMLRSCGAVELADGNRIRVLHPTAAVLQALQPA